MSHVNITDAKARMVLAAFWLGCGERGALMASKNEGA